MGLTAGSHLGPYKVLAPLGAGGMGEVYRCWDPRLEREVAIKILPEHLTEDPATLARFGQEAKTVAALSHPNVLAIHDIGLHQKVSYIVTELLQGETLKESIERAPLGWRRAVEVATAVADGLSAVHSHGIVHRDLKPANLFLTTDGHIKILDFGIARSAPRADDDATGVIASALTRTDAGTVKGTIGYMSPEQVRGTAVEPTSDIFALGCVLFEMIAGRRPFAGHTVPDLLVSILTEEAPTLRDVWQPVPAGLERVIGRCLEKDPAQRYQTAGELKLELLSLLTGAPGTRVVPIKRKAVESIAVLPFQNDGSPDVEYFADGVTESIINNLAQLPKLRVIARSTAFRYKNKEWDARRIARELNVNVLLTGRLMQRGEHISLQVELVRAADATQLWGQRYNRPVADIIQVEADIAREISEKLKFTLTGPDKKRLAVPKTYNSQAYQLYLKGRFLWNKRHPEAILKSIPFFEQAIAEDPSYALAYSGLADSYSLLSTTSIIDPLIVFPKGKAAAQKAIELNDTLAEAHASMVLVNIYWDWDWAAVERSYEKAQRLNPNYPTLHHWFSIYSCARSRFEKAEEEIRLAQELDPLSLIINTHVGWVLYFARRYDEAIRQYRKTLEMEPQFVMARFLLSCACVQTREYDEAIAGFEQAIDQTKRGSTEMIGALGNAYGMAGRHDEARAILDELLTISQQRYVSPFDVATVYVGLGDVDKSFEWLEKAYQGRAQWMVGLAVDPRLDPIRQDPRFHDLLKRLNLLT